MSETLTAPALLAALAPTGKPVDCGTGDLRVVQRNDLILVCFDYRCNQGSIGIAEADQLVSALQMARRERNAIVFLLETSGIRVTDATAGIASLRRVLREALDARLDGVRMLAMVLKSAFGGASMLAAACERIVINPASLFAMSGPRLIEASAGQNCFNASDPDAVLGLMGGAARGKASQKFLLVSPTIAAYETALADWQATAAPQVAVPEIDTQSSRSLTLNAPQGAGVTHASVLAGELQTIAKCLSIQLDSESHLGHPEDEQQVLSEALVNLAIALRRHHRAGAEVELVITGRAGGGILAALGAAAGRVTMMPEARLCVLPPAAMQALKKSEPEGAGLIETAIRVHAVDGPYIPPEEVS